MANYNQSSRKAIRDINQGIVVTKAASSCAATATVDLFEITGGSIMVLGLVGIWDGAAAAAATTIALGANPTTGTATVLGTASATQSGKAAGSMLTMASDLGQVVSSTNQGAALIDAVPRVFVRGPGKIQMTVAGATNTQTITWHLIYVPVENDSAVVAA